MEDKTAATDPVTFRDIQNGSSTNFPSDSACYGLYIANPKQASGEFQIRVRDSEKLPYNWMAKVSGSRSIADLSIPGTHDSGATWGVSKTGRCQTLSIFDQLFLKGVRFLDIRCRIDAERLRICHGVADQNLWLEDVLDQCLLFLRLNPSESIIMSVKKEKSGDDENRFEELFYQKYYNTNTRLWYGENKVPSLSDVRGRIILFRRFASQNTAFPARGIDACPNNWGDNKIFDIVRSDKSIRVQDVYNVNSPEDKFAKVKAFILESSNSKWYINFASAICTLIPDAATVSNVVNVELDKYLVNTKFKGVLLMDYIDQNSDGDKLSVSRKIINMN